MKPSEYFDKLIKNEPIKDRNILSPVYIPDYWGMIDKRFIDKEELKKKINNIKKIYDDVEGRELPGERYTYYETITYAKLHQLLDELLEE